MAVYIIVALVAVAILWAAYRTLGGGAGPPPDPVVLMHRAAASATGAAQRLGDALPGAAVEMRAIRRTLEGCAQLLERVDTLALDAAGAQGHALLTAAVEDLGWAARLGETAGLGTNAALRRAAGLLQDEARRALDEAGRALASRMPEVIDGPA